MNDPDRQAEYRVEAARITDHPSALIPVQRIFNPLKPNWADGGSSQLFLILLIAGPAFPYYMPNLILPSLDPFAFLLRHGPYF